MKLSEQQKQDMAEGMFPFHDSHSIEDKQSQILQRDAFIAGLQAGLSHVEEDAQPQQVTTGYTREIESIISKSINRHLVAHVPVNDTRDRVVILCEEATKHILEYVDSIVPSGQSDAIEVLKELISLEMMDAQINDDSPKELVAEYYEDRNRAWKRAKAIVSKDEE